VRRAATCCDLEEIRLGKALRFLQYGCGDRGLLVVGEAAGYLQVGRIQIGNRLTDSRHCLHVNAFDQPGQDFVKNVELAPAQPVSIAKQQVGHLAEHKRTTRGRLVPNGLFQFGNNVGNIVRSHNVASPIRETAMSPNVISRGNI
jgi:hypothetical protein